MTQSYVTWLIHMRNDSFVCDMHVSFKWDMTNPYVTWHIHKSSICDMIHVWFQPKATYEWPPDPISHVCSLTGKYILRKHFTYRSVQIFKIMFRRFLFSRIWSSAQDHALLVLLLNLVGFFISSRPRWSGGNDLYHSCTSFEGAFWGGQPLNTFTWFIGAGGLSYVIHSDMYDIAFMCGVRLRLLVRYLIHMWYDARSA